MGAAEALGGLVKYRLGNPFRIGVHVPVPEADDGPALRLKVTGAGFVAAGRNVLTAVYLHNEAGLAAGEVGNVRLDR